MNVLTVDYNQNNAEEIFTKSLKETGFSVIENHPIDWNLIEKVYDEWRNFMNSSSAEKYLFNKSTQDGYFPKNISEIAKNHSKKDLKHYFHLYFPWGQYPDEVSSLAKELFHQMYDLGRTLLKWIDNNLSEETSMNLKSSFYQSLSFERTLLRILHYPALVGTEEPGAIRAAAHEDINLITLLPVASSPGLEIYSPNDKKWIEVPCKSKSIIVNIGDMMQEMTNYEYIATKHRVVNPKETNKSEDRMSLPCFLHAKADIYLSEKYPTADHFLQERLSALGVK